MAEAAGLDRECVSVGDGGGEPEADAVAAARAIVGEDWAVLGVAPGLGVGLGVGLGFGVEGGTGSNFVLAGGMGSSFGEVGGTGSSLVRNWAGLCSGSGGDLGETSALPGRRAPRFMRRLGGMLRLGSTGLDLTWTGGLAAAGCI